MTENISDAEIKLGMVAGRYYSKKDMDKRKKDYFFTGDWCEWCKEWTEIAHYHWRGKRYEYTKEGKLICIKRKK